MVRGSKKSVHPTATSIHPGTSPSLAAASLVETSTSPAVASIPTGTSPSPTVASPVGFYTSEDLDSIFVAAVLESGAHVSPSTALSTMRMLLRPALSSLACPPVPGPSSAPSSQGVVDSHILILPTIDKLHVIAKIELLLFYGIVVC
ncbi:hypothetical protein M9H77_31384 [Catharanthus roseus]|uniref:Uncharacterized protein n=1 Tax=Catharanthus roseus TaxID=4058 RepID=A0ACC0A2L2_CATRO|nr:hypothetical protein M9H77_31384 [Catharanthus roseus]